MDYRQHYTQHQKKELKSLNCPSLVVSVIFATIPVVTAIRVIFSTIHVVTANSVIFATIHVVTAIPIIFTTIHVVTANPFILATIPVVTAIPLKAEPFSWSHLPGVGAVEAASLHTCLQKARHHVHRETTWTAPADLVEYPNHEVKRATAAACRQLRLRRGSQAVTPLVGTASGTLRRQRSHPRCRWRRRRLHKRGSRTSKAACRALPR